MDEIYQNINALSKVVYGQWDDGVSFDFASFVRDNRELPFRIVWTTGEWTRVNTMNSGAALIPQYQFECVRYLQSEESNLYQFLTDVDVFVSLLAEQGWSIVSVGAIDTATPDRVAIIIEAYTQ